MYTTQVVHEARPPVDELTALAGVDVWENISRKTLHLAEPGAARTSGCRKWVRPEEEGGPGGSSYFQYLTIFPQVPRKL